MLLEDCTFQDKDVIDPEVYEQVGHPQYAFAWLRASDPLRMVEPEGFRLSGSSLNMRTLLK